MFGNANRKRGVRLPKWAGGRRQDGRMAGGQEAQRGMAGWRSRGDGGSLKFGGGQKMWPTWLAGRFKVKRRTPSPSDNQSRKVCYRMRGNPVGEAEGWGAGGEELGKRGERAAGPKGNTHHASEREIQAATKFPLNMGKFLSNILFFFV